MQEIIAARIKGLRVDNKLTQVQLGERLSVSQDTISLWETAKSIPPVEYVIEMCKLFSVSSDYLLGLNDY